MRARASAVVFAVAASIASSGCGRLRFDDGGAGADAAPAADAELGAFGPPRLMTELSDPSARDDDPSPTGDLLELYFNSARAGGPGGGDIWVSTRASVEARWGAPVLVAELSSPATETGPEVSDDGLICLFASDRAGSIGATDIWMSTRTERSQPWGVPVHVPELSSTADDTAPAVRAGGLTIVFESTRGAGDANLWIAERASRSSPWSAPVMLDVNTAGHEGSPYLLPDGRTLLFNSTRAGGIGLADLYLVTRSGEGAPFSGATRIEVSSTANDEDPWMSSDGRLLLFASNRSGQVELYEAKR